MYEKTNKWLVGLEPRSLCLEVQRTTHWASKSVGYNLEMDTYIELVTPLITSKTTPSFQFT